MARFSNASGQAADFSGYAEAAYFGGFAFQHIAAWEESKRLARIATQSRNAAALRLRGERRHNGRALYAAGAFA